MTRKINGLISIIITIAVVLIVGATASYAATVKNGTAYVDTPGSAAILRAKASTSSSSVKVLSDNTKLTVKKIVFVSKTSTASTKKWYYVSVGGKTGYIRADLVDGQKYTAVQAKVTSKVTYRAGAGTKMKSKGSLAKGKKVQVLLKATPVSSTKGSSSTWYMIKYNNKKYYACSTSFKLLDDVDPTPPPEEDPTPVTDEEFKAKLVAQGFDDAYVTKLMKLHKDHPKWKFTALKTNLDWNDVLKAETKDGVSLIHSSYPISYRDTHSYSLETTKKTIYKSASTSSTNKGTIAAGKAFTLLDEVWKDKTQWLHVISSSDVKGYIQSGLYSQTYETTFAATVTDNDVNIRCGAGTANSVVGSKNKGDSITVVLKAKDKNGKVWYKIKYDSDYAYIVSTYVKFESETAEEELAAVKASGKAGKFKAKDGSTWFNASSKVVAYYLDPRNFLVEEDGDCRICMFEKQTYDEETQTQEVVAKVLLPTKLPGYGFTADLFVNAGKTYDVSPVFLASRARQETGGGSDCINGTKVNGTKVYNPFNIGASSSANPVAKALQYAYDKGWTTQKKAVNGGAKFLSDGYISAKQYSIYLQRFNVANGASKAGTHQYMTNITAPYTESYSVMSSYKSFEIDEEALTFVIPIYNSMPSKTSLPG